MAKIILTFLSALLCTTLSIAAPLIPSQPLSNIDPSSTFNITTRDDVLYSNFDSVDATGICDTNFGKPGQCSFATWTHWPATDTLEDSSHAFYAFNSRCEVIGYVPAVNLKGYDKYSFGARQTRLPYYIDVRFGIKIGYGWAPNIWYNGRSSKDSKCWYEETSSGWRHSQGVCKIAFTC